MLRTSSANRLINGSVSECRPTGISGFSTRSRIRNAPATIHTSCTQSRSVRIVEQSQLDLFSSLKLPKRPLISTRCFTDGNMASATMAAANRLSNTMQTGSAPAFGAWQMLPGTTVSRLLCSAGYDWILIDCEHGDIDDAAMRDCVRVIADCGVSPIVRIPGLENWMVKRALDGGAHGILVPLVRTVEECENLVKWSKFPPAGVRGFGAPTAHTAFGLNNAREYLLNANDNILVMVQIETKEALENIEEICKVDGLDGVLIGPNDLGLNIGHPLKGSEMPPKLTEAVDKILKTVKANGKKVGMFCANGTLGKKAADQGFDFISVIVDAYLVGGQEHLATAKGLHS